MFLNKHNLFSDYIVNKTNNIITILFSKTSSALLINKVYSLFHSRYRHD